MNIYLQDTHHKVLQDFLQGVLVGLCDPFLAVYMEGSYYWFNTLRNCHRHKVGGLIVNSSIGNEQAGQKTLLLVCIVRLLFQK